MFDQYPHKPKVARMPDGRVAVYVAAAYEYLTDDAARALRDQLDQVLAGAPACGKGLSKGEA